MMFFKYSSTLRSNTSILSWDETWDDVTLTIGTSAGHYDTITVTIDTTGFDPGSTHSCGIQIESYGANRLFTVMVNIGECPEVIIEEITGGLFRVNAKLKNIGSCDIVGLDWKIHLNGVIIILGREITERLPIIPKDGEATITSNLIFGLGSIVVSVDTEISEIISDS